MLSRVAWRQFRISRFGGAAAPLRPEEPFDLMLSSAAAAVHLSRFTNKTKDFGAG
jgi:hypothetical protein